VQIVLKSGSLNLLEPLGPVKACDGIALSVPYERLLQPVKNFMMVGQTVALCKTWIFSLRLKIHKTDNDMNFEVLTVMLLQCDIVSLGEMIPFIKLFQR
jgi:hypothetical protein